MRDFNTPYTAAINGQDVTAFGALVESYSIGGTPVTSSLFLGRNRTTPRLLSHTIGMRPITLNLFFAAPTQKRLAMNKSALDALLVGLPEINFPDGFLYRCSLQSIGDLKILGVEGNQVIATCSYKLTGIRHDSLETHVGNTIFAQGTMPRMDCRLACTTTQARETLQMGPVTFTSVPSGARVIADGIDGILTVGGEPAVGATFLHLPYLVPGEQTLTCPELLTIEYYPTYI